MRILGKIVIRLLVAYIILLAPAMVMASGDADDVGNGILALSLGGCFDEHSA